MFAEPTHTQKRGFNDTKSPSSSLLLGRRRRWSSSAAAAPAEPGAPDIPHEKLVADAAEVSWVVGKRRVIDDGDRGGISSLCLLTHILSRSREGEGVDVESWGFAFLPLFQKTGFLSFCWFLSFAVSSE